MEQQLAPLAIQHVMATPVEVCSPLLTVGEAVRLAQQKKLTGLVLADGDEIKGIVKTEELPKFAGSLTLGKCLAMEGCRVIEQDTPLEVLVENHFDRETGWVVLDQEHKPVGIVDTEILLRNLWKGLLLHRQQLACVLETVGEAVTIIDEEERVLAWNKPAENMYGISRLELLGKSIKPYFTDLMLTRVMKDRQKVRNAYHQPRAGSHIQINATPVILDGKVLGSVSADRDITEIVYLNQELTKASAQVRILETQIKKAANGPFVSFRRILGHSPRLAETITLAKRVAGTDAAVLIRGESGTGKELFAEAIHLESRRRDRPFVVINCGAIPSTLFESELFGYQGGAFTGADKKGKPGKFELANGGTLFLDEVGELPLEMQVKLLRVLQSKVFYRVGGSEPINVDVRIIAATNRNLESMIQDGRFRDDLYYRLNVVSLEIPPLRERKEDVPELIHFFVQEFSRIHNRIISHLAPEVMASLLEYSWPGNIRELRNMAERLVVLADGEIIKKEHLPGGFAVNKGVPAAAPSVGRLTELTEQAERNTIRAALERAGGNKAKAAEILAIPRSTLYYKMKSLGITG
ncbi:MAG: sigma 54-interacting transcriptional regulator [Bacillota bacterium]